MTPFSAAHLLTLLKTSRAEGLFEEQRSKWDREQRAYWEALQREAVRVQRQREEEPLK